MNHRLSVAGATLLLTAFSGCCGAGRPFAFPSVKCLVEQRTGKDAVWLQNCADRTAIDATVAEMLKKELTVDDAVQIALYKSPSLQATFEELGISQADLWQAGLPKNPGFSFAALIPSIPPSATRLEMSATEDFFDLLLLPLRKSMAAQELEQTKLRVGNEVLDLVARTKTDYYTLQSRYQLLSRLKLIAEVNAAAAELSQRQYQAGTRNDLELATQQSINAQAKIEVLQSGTDVQDAREKLHHTMGLGSAPSDWKIAQELPPIPDREIDLEELESLALLQRLDLKAACRRVAVLDRALQIQVKSRHFPGGIQMGVSSERETDRQWSTGPSLNLELPIFDHNQARIDRLEAQLRQARWQVSNLEGQIRFEVRQARNRLLGSRQLADSYGKGLLPQRIQILNLTLEHYNAMLRGPYDLLQAKENEANAERNYINAWRDYWLARTDLEHAIAGTLPLKPASGAPPSTESVPAGEPESKPEEMPDHGQMQGHEGMHHEGMQMPKTGSGSAGASEHEKKPEPEPIPSPP